MISRALSAGGDTLIYVVHQQSREEDCASPTNPYCYGAGPTTTVFPLQTTALRFLLYSGIVPSLLLAPRESTLSAATLPDVTARNADQRNADQRNAGTLRDSVFTGCWTPHYVTSIRSTVFGPCTFAFGGVIDGIEASITVGVGEPVSRDLQRFCYGHPDGLARKEWRGVRQFRQLPDWPVGLSALLRADAVQLCSSLATTAARLVLTSTKGGLLTLIATDALGRRVWQHTQQVGLETEVSLPVAAWAPGVYYVRVSLPEGARVVRVVRD